MGSALLWAPFLFFSGNLTASDHREQIEIAAVVDWSRYKIFLKATQQIPGEMNDEMRPQLRESLRQALLTKSSQLVESLVFNAPAEDEEKNENILARLNHFFRLQKLASFQVAENRALGTLEIALRGKDSVLFFMPNSANLESYNLIERGSVSDVQYETANQTGEYQTTHHESIPYTSLVVDARHLNFKPGLNPAIFSQNGRLIYSADFLTAETLKKRGAAGFSENLNERDIQLRTGSRPLRISALELFSQQTSSVVISEEDAEKILRHEKSISNLKKARVAFLVAKGLLVQKVFLPRK